MPRPRLAPLVALTATLVMAAAWCTPAVAAGVATFRLTNVDPAGSVPVSTVLARIKPPSAVVARDVAADPPTILPESSGYVSSGFDPDSLEVGLIEGSTDSGDPFQILKLDFGAGGFGPGSRLYFQLNKAPNYTGDVELILPDSVTNLAIEAMQHIDPPKSDEGKGGGAVTPPDIGPGVQVPEPVSAVLWLLVVAGLGLARVHAYRRSFTRTQSAVA